MARRTRAQQPKSIEIPMIGTDGMAYEALPVVPTLTNDEAQTATEYANTVPMPHFSVEKFDQLVNGAAASVASASSNELAPANVVMDVDPDDVAVDEEIKAIRSWTEGGIWAKGQGTAQEMQLGELARTMYEEGQRQPCNAFIHEDTITIWDGVRRREAVKIIREEWEPERQLRVLVDSTMTRDQAIRAALLTFTQHEGLTPRERAKVIAFLRRKYDWGGKEGTSERAEGTAKIAEYLGVSPATVTNDERLAQAPAELQDLVECGRMTMTNALEAISTTGDLPKEDRPQAQAKIAKRAEEMAEEEAETKRTTTRKTERTRKDEVGQSTGEDESIAPWAQESRESVSDRTDETAREVVDAANTPVPVERRHVKAAAREVLGDKAKVKAPLMRDAIELIEQWCGPAYPPVMRSWADAFVEYGHGKLAGAKLEAAWDRISDALLAKPSAQIKIIQRDKSVAKNSTKPDLKAKAKATATAGAKKGGKK